MYVNVCTLGAHTRIFIYKLWHTFLFRTLKKNERGFYNGFSTF